MEVSNKPARAGNRYCLPLAESETFDFSKARKFALPKLKAPIGPDLDPLATAPH